jgi:recombination protein RecT
MGDTAEELPSTYVQAIKQTESRFIKVAPSSMKFEAEMGFAMSLIRNNDYMMKAAVECPQSLQQAMAAVAGIGLSLNPAKKEAYLITRNVKTKQDNREFWQTRIYLEPSYMGLCNIATNTGSIEWVQAKCVYSADEFTDHGPGIRPTHTYNAFAKKEARGEFVGVYCVAKTSTGDYLTTIMPAEDVVSIRDRSEAWKRNQSGPWKTDFEEMAKKAVIRNAFKTWPKTDKFARLEEAVHISNENEGFAPILTSPELGSYTAEQKGYFDQLITNADALGMYTFQCTCDQSVFTNLYNSFEKGSVTKYKKIVGDLIARGSAVMLDCVSAITDAIEAGDDAGVLEVLEGMHPDTEQIVGDRLAQKHVAEFARIAKVAA